MANNSRLRKALKKVSKPQSGWLDVFPAVIGKEDGTVLTGVAGEIYVRNVLNGQTLTVHNTVAPAIATLQVEVGRRVEQPGLWQIKGVRESFSTPAGGSKVAYHKEQHIFPAPDAPIIPRKQIRELTVLVTDGPNFIVQVFGGDVRGSTAYFLVDSQTVDLSSYVPATGAIYVNIETDESGVLSINTGADFLTPALGTAADIPIPATGQRRIATILLYETMTELLDSHILVPMVLESEAGGGGSGMEPGYLPWKHYARLATAAGLPAHTYDNTAGTITATSTGTLTVDGVLVALDDYILVKNDTTKNGLYKCTTAGAVGVAFVLTRAEDMNEASEFPGATIKVGPEGTGFGNSLIYECTNASVILGTTSIAFDTIQARPIGAAGGDLTGLYPSPTVLNSAVIGKILTGFSAGAGTVSATDTILQALQKVVGNIALKLTANSPITGATKTKITYDANGLVTAGADATTADIADSTNKRYVTDAQLTVIGNTSGTNSGNETATTIGALIGGAGDATPNDTDFVATSLTAGGILKKITWTNIKAFLKTYWDTLYAPIAKGVTNGDSHDHNGGDGGIIAYGSLSSRPTAENNSNDIFRVDNPGGASLWTGTISGAPSGTSVTVSAPASGTEAVLVPTSTSQLAKMRLYNLTRGTSALINNYNTGTNVITLTATVPAAWANGDSLTIVSQTVSGGGFNWIDLEITSGLTGKSYIFVFCALLTGAAGDVMRTHPLETFGVGKVQSLSGQVAGVVANSMMLVKVTSNVYSISWSTSPTAVVFRETGYLE